MLFLHVQEGDRLNDANEAILQTRRYVCDSEGSRAAEVEAEPGGVVPSERAEIQVRSDRATGAGELVKFGQPVWYRFSFKIAGDWPQHTWTSPTRLAITTGWPAGFAANPEISGEDGLSKNRPECEPGHVRLGS